MQIQEANFLNGDVKIFKNAQRPQILFQCEHATNTLPHEHHWSENDTKHFQQTHWAIDLGALKLAEWLAERTNSILVNSTFNRNHCAATMAMGRLSSQIQICKCRNCRQESKCIRHTIQHQVIIITILELAIDEVNPKEKSGKSKWGYQPAILMHLDRQYQIQSKFKHQAIIQQSGFNCLINEPYTGKDGLNFAIDSSCLSRSPPIPGTLFEVRQDILQDPIQFEKVANAILKSIIHVTENQ